MNKKEWPKDGSPLMFEDLCDHIRRALEFTYDLQRKNIGRDVPWDGPDLGKKDQVCCSNPSGRLKHDYLKWLEEDRGRDALGAIIEIAVQLGMEQGRRLWWQQFCDLSILDFLSMVDLGAKIDELKARMEP